MKEGKNLIRNCMTCEHYGLRCEEICPFDVADEAGARTDLRMRRRNMKADKARRYERAMQKLNSAENKAEIETDYQKSKKKRVKHLQEELEQHKNIHEDKAMDWFHAYPATVFRARADVIKQGERRLKRLKKNQA